MRPCSPLHLAPLLALALALATGFASSPAVATMTFAPSVELAVGARPFFVLLADVDDDGDLDIHVVLRDSNAVSTLLNRGDGSFDLPRTQSTASQPWEIAAADLNGDGHLDLAVALDGCPDVSILLGRGDGTFEESREVPTGAGTNSVAIGDLNGDGNADLVLTSGFIDVVMVLLGDGSGAFGEPVYFPAGFLPKSLVLADLDRDGNLDAATANAGHVTHSWEASVLLGRGDGSFGPRTPYGAGLWPIAIATGDLDSNGDPDLVVANDFSGELTILVGNGDGTYRVSEDDVSGGAGLLTIADLDGDDRADVIVPNLGTADTVQILPGNGDGTFAPAEQVRAGSRPYAVAAGDLDGDGWPDLVTANGGDSTVSVLLNRANVVSVGTPGAPGEIGISSVSPNPAREGATIRFAMSTDGQVRLRVYDVGGRLVRSLRTGPMPAGRHSAPWDLRNGIGSRVSPGIYTIELRTGDRRSFARVVVLP